MNVELLNMLPRLANAQPYQTNDLDAARTHIGALFVPHNLDVVGRQQVLDVRIGRVQLEGISLIYHRHGASVRVRPQPFRDFFLLQIPICGEAYVKVDQQEICCCAKQAVMISPDAGVDMRFGQGCEQLIVRVERIDLERYLEHQLGRPMTVPLQFSPAVPLTTPGAKEIGSLLQFMMISLTDSEGIGGSPFARRNMASLLLTGLLSCLDHNYRDQLVRGPGRLRPAYIAKAQAYMKANIRRPIAPEDVAAAVHVSTRALFAGFKTYLNTTPMRYLKDLRLEMVRRTLIKFDPQEASVTTIAMDHGFEHLGHFCAAYQKKFGEQPRKTLHKFVSDSELRDYEIVAQRPAMDMPEDTKVLP
ncbi:MAG: AraC family transcriptional regulator [Gammaproteobacteria bacterium]